MTLRHLSLAMAIIALVLTPILLCCGSSAASAQAVVTEHDCGHAEPAPAPPTDDQACDGCDDCASPVFANTVKTVDPTLGPPTASPAWAVAIVTRPARSDAMRPPQRAPPRATPARLSDKLTV